MILETVFYNDNATGLRRKPFCMQQNGAAPFSIFFRQAFLSIFGRCRAEDISQNHSGDYKFGQGGNKSH